MLLGILGNFPSSQHLATLLCLRRPGCMRRQRGGSWGRLGRSHSARPVLPDVSVSRLRLRV